MTSILALAWGPWSAGPSSSRCASAVAQVALSGCRASRVGGEVFVLFPELPLEDLPAGVLRHGVGDDDVLGCLIARELGAGVPDHRFFGEGGAWLGNDYGDDRLDPPRVGNAEDGDFGDSAIW